MENKPHVYVIRRSWILSVFLIIPVLFGFGMWDYTMNNAALQTYFTISSLLLPAYLLFFEMPHVIASFIGFADRQYLRHYRHHLLWGIPLMLTAFFVLVWQDFYSAVAVYLMVTMYHVVRQQTGIAHMFGVPKNRWHFVWSWGLIIGSALLYVWIMRYSQLILGVDRTLVHIAAVLLVISGLAGSYLTWSVRGWQAKVYIGATILMSIASYIMIEIGYLFLSIFIVRFIHDVTSFLFYITHEMNRNHRIVHNALYRFLPLVPVSLVLLVPTIAVLLGLLLREAMPSTTVLFVVIMAFGFVHYYLESVMWKRDALHRQSIKVV